MKKIASFLSLLGVVIMFGTLSSCSGDFGNKNRECIKCIKCNELPLGETFELDGVIYTVADRKMLDEALKKGKDLTKYCTSKVTDMGAMFGYDTSFNQDIGDWDVSNVNNMNLMFGYASSFNQDIGNWDVSNVTAMKLMFTDAEDFNQDLSQWCVSKIPSIQEYFSTDSGLTPENHPVWGTCP